MTFHLHKDFISRSSCPLITKKADYEFRYHSRTDMYFSPEKLTEEMLDAIYAEAKAQNSQKIRPAIDAIRSMRAGKLDTKIPNSLALEAMLHSFFAQHRHDGWVYRRGRDGQLYPYAICSTSFKYQQGNTRIKEPWIEIRLAATGEVRRSTRKYGGQDITTIGVTPADSTRRTVEEALLECGYLIETPELRAEYDDAMKRYQDIIADQFGKEFDIEGVAALYSDRYRDAAIPLTSARAVQINHKKATRDRDIVTDVSLHGVDNHEVCIPLHPLAEYMDLDTKEKYWVHANHAAPHIYDKKLTDKLILPDTHRDLLEVLTSRDQLFAGDIIDGKVAGNLIVCKGPPGVGKTLTAEIMAAVTERPLYRVNAGSLGTSPHDIASNLQDMFTRAKEWGAITLIDECDVFVAQRGADINQNAIVAEFLQALEYYDGILFMTTNRPDDIDDAILNRAIAIIDYEIPTNDNARKIWRVMSDQFGAMLSDELINELASMLPTIAPRDIKMLTVLAMKMVKGDQTKIDADLFRRCAMFRGIKFGQSVSDNNEHSARTVADLSNEQKRPDYAGG